ncbi:MAG: hypothetical protein C4332_00785 [Meiothermus sp.]
MKVVRGFLLVSALGLGGAALAQKTDSGDSKPGQAKSGDVVVNVNVPAVGGITQALPINPLGQAAHSAQEKILTPVSSATGTQRYYVWVGVGGQYVPVDPMRVTK